MSEFHIKNTDPQYHSTFGFSPDELKKGVIDLREIRKIIEENAGTIPVDEFVGYLEIGGPKVGLDYSDPMLERSLRESLTASKAVFSD